MKRVRDKLFSAGRFLSEEIGLSTPEYALLLGLIVLVCIGSLEVLSSAANEAFNSVNDQLGQGGTTAPTVASDPGVARTSPTVASSTSGP